MSTKPKDEVLPQIQHHRDWLKAHPEAGAKFINLRAGSAEWHAEWTRQWELSQMTFSPAAATLARAVAEHNAKYH
jgi:GrpB-like predicted nucleotidyltransferase (UPF0157 family)